MKIRRNVSLAKYTTLNVGGVAEYFVKVASVEELKPVQRFATQIAAPVLLLGSGSNVLISDDGYAGIVVINQIKGITYEPIDDTAVRVTVGAGELLDDVVIQTVTKGYWGLENLSHIPGTVGAAPIQNVGAYGVEMSMLVDTVTAMSLQSGEIKTFTCDECDFSYRDSYFKTTAGRDWFVVSVAMILSKSRRPQLQYGDLQQLNQQLVSLADIREKVITIRASKFPDWQVVGTAGSFFMNPIVGASQRDYLLEQYPELPTFVMADGRYKVALGWILDKVCGLKGYQDGQVALYKDQALVLTNTGHSATDIITFVTKIQQIVKAKTNIDIQPEVRFV